MGNEENRSHDAVSRILGGRKSKKEIPVNRTIPNEELTKKSISTQIGKQGSSARRADSIRINPILQSALLYLTTIKEPGKSKPDVIEEMLLKYMPEDILIEGYKMARDQKKI